MENRLCPVPTGCSLGDSACEGGKQQIMEEVARQSGGSSQVIMAPPAAPAKVQCILVIPPEPLLMAFHLAELEGSSSGLILPDNL